MDEITLMDSTLSPATEKPGPRSFKVLDCARLLAVLSIVWLHTQNAPGLEALKDIGRFGVPFFTFAAVLLAFLSALRHPETSIFSYIKFRFKRIYLVFLAWTLIYAVFRIAGYVLLRSPLPPQLWNEFLQTGTAHHLWFLPFVFYASVLSFTVARRTAGSRAGYWTIIVCLVLVTIIGVSPSPISFRALSFTSGLYPDVLPSALLGIAFAMAYARMDPELFNRRAVVAAGAILWLGCLAILLASQRIILLETLSGLGLLIASLNKRDSPLIRRFAGWGKFAFGIYILHVLFLEGFQNVTEKFGWLPSWQNDVTTFFFTMICCVISICLLNKNARTRKLLL